LKSPNVPAPLVGSSGGLAGSRPVPGYVRGLAYPS